jgi:Uma2 family endonuclease
MRAVLLQPPQSFLDERRRTGADRWDEVWQGVLHMVPPSSNWHQCFGTKLLVALVPVAEALGLEASYKTGLFRPGAGESDYRVPDLVVSRPEARSKRGVEGRAELVVELLSEDDESREKLPFYESLGVQEVLLVDPESREVEFYVLRGGKLHVVLPDAEGGVRSQVLGIAFKPIAGPKLRVLTPTGGIEI